MAEDWEVRSLEEKLEKIELKHKENVNGAMCAGMLITCLFTVLIFGHADSLLKAIAYTIGCLFMSPLLMFIVFIFKSISEYFGKYIAYGVAAVICILVFLR